LRADRYRGPAQVRGSRDANPGGIVAVYSNAHDAPPTPPVIQIPGLVTFTTDGSAIETDGSEFVPNPSTTPINARTPGHGIWQTGPTPGSLYVEYISLVLNADGSLSARNVTTMLLALNSKGNQFSRQLHDGPGGWRRHHQLCPAAR
jgi:hypothetical protein